MTNYQLKPRQICLFFISFTAVTKFFTMPSIIAKIANEDMWICSLINVLLDLSTIIALVFVCKKHKKTFIGLLEENLGKPITKIIIFLYFLYFLLKSFIPINEQKAFVELALYINLTTDLYFIPFFIVAFYISTKELRVWGRVADVVWIITLGGFFLLIALSITNTDFLAILPIGARGFKNVAKGSYLSANWFGESAYFLFFIGEFAYEKKYGLKIILSYLAGAIMLIIFMIIFYGIFTSIAFRQSFALTEIAKYTTVINNIGRFDYLGIIMVLFANIFALSVPVFFACRCLNYLFNLKQKWISSLIVIAFLFVLTIALNEFYYSLEKLFSGYLSAYFLIMANIIPLICLFFTKKEKKNAFEKT